jgi:hypothetical protein
MENHNQEIIEQMLFHFEEEILRINRSIQMPKKMSNLFKK